MSAVDGTVQPVDLIDASEYDFLLPKRLRRGIAIGLLVGLATVPSVREWFVGQVVLHAQHTAQEIIDDLVAPDLEGLSPTPPGDQGVKP